MLSKHDFIKQDQLEMITYGQSGACERFGS